jgi:hypothetical protein
LRGSRNWLKQLRNELKQVVVRHTRLSLLLTHRLLLTSIDLPQKRKPRPEQLRLRL